MIDKIIAINKLKSFGDIFDAWVKYNKENIKAISYIEYLEKINGTTYRHY